MENKAVMDDLKWEFPSVDAKILEILKRRLPDNPDHYYGGRHPMLTVTVEITEHEHHICTETFRDVANGER